MGAREEYYKSRSEERRRAFAENAEKLESGCSLCVRCDGRGVDGYRKKMGNGASQPDFGSPAPCPVCGGWGYVELTEDDRARLLGR